MPALESEGGLDRMGRKNWGKIPSISALNYELTNHTQFISFPPFMPIFDLRNCPLICWVASDGDGDDDAGNCGERFNGHGMQNRYRGLFCAANSIGVFINL